MINAQLCQHKATLEDLPAIINLLVDDDLGQTRESTSPEPTKQYIDAFRRIDVDPNQYLMVVCDGAAIVGTCHLTIMPSLTFQGSTRMQIEAVRVAATRRGEKIGEWMMTIAFEYARKHHASIIQLTTNKQRPRAKQFYERLGFKDTHDGMKYHY